VRRVPTERSMRLPRDADVMTILTTERLRLEPFDDARLDGLNAINSDPEVMRYLGPSGESQGHS
jgi:hypothetical protein